MVVTQRCQHEAVMGDRPSNTPLAIMTSLNEPNNYVMSDTDDEGTKASETSSSVKVLLNAKRNADNQIFKKEEKVEQQQHLVRIRIIVPAMIRTDI